MSSRKIVDYRDMRQFGPQTELNRTNLRGKTVMQDDEIVGKPGDGQIVAPAKGLEMRKMTSRRSGVDSYQQDCQL